VIDPGCACELRQPGQCPDTVRLFGIIAWSAGSFGARGQATYVAGGQ
jgi:hypothetical protein